MNIDRWIESLVELESLQDLIDVRDEITKVIDAEQLYTQEVYTDNELYRRKKLRPKPIEILGNVDEHPSWCKCQRVCGGDQ